MSEEEKWEEEAKEALRRRIGLDYSSDQEGMQKAFVKGYLQACRKRQGDEITLELAFSPDGKFSGIIVGDHLIESGEVVEYIKRGQKEIEKLKEEMKGMVKFVARDITKTCWTPTY